MKIVCEEVFAPIVSLIKVTGAQEAFTKINSAPYGLQHAVFTNSLPLAKEAISTLECGGVLINEMPTLRLDNAPYGGVKLSGVGREGPKFAMEEFSEIKSVVIY
jgi:acyl-CoA reductase-like NAD-dependent aldehyde dehydrogenase